jgi:hypothetical protein
VHGTHHPKKARSRIKITLRRDGRQRPVFLR